MQVVYFSSTFPYVILTAMLIRGLTLDGAAQGLIYYLKPDFSRLADATVLLLLLPPLLKNLDCNKWRKTRMAAYVTLDI